MAAPNKPSGWEWNPAVITLLLVLASLIAGGSWYLGYQAAVIDGIKQDAAESKRAAQTALAVASGGIEEEPSPTPAASPKRK